MILAGANFYQINQNLRNPLNLNLFKYSEN